MNGLTTGLLSRACRIYLELAYPEGAATIPPPAVAYWELSTEQPLAPLLGPPVGEPLPSRGGHALRLGSTDHPHLKFLVLCDETGDCIFAVDTHDAAPMELRDPDAPRWPAFQAANRRLKERIERAWEDAGLLTFNALLRRELARG